MDPAFHPALAALLGAATGALTSVATAWLAQRHQHRSQWMTQERGRRERIFSEFMEQASKAFAEALSHSSLEDPAKLVPLYATIGKLRLFSSKRTLSAADEVMAHILETFYSPNPDFTSPPSQTGRDFDFLLSFTKACRAELGSNSTDIDSYQKNARHPEALAWPRNAEGVLTFDLAVDGRK